MRILLLVVILKEFTNLKNYTLYEDMATGKITVSGRGNDYQQVSMEYVSR